MGGWPSAAHWASVDSAQCPAQSQCWQGAWGAPRMPGPTCTSLGSSVVGVDGSDILWTFLEVSHSWERGLLTSRTAVIFKPVVKTRAWFLFWERGLPPQPWQQVTVVSQPARQAGLSAPRRQRGKAGKPMPGLLTGESAAELELPAEHSAPEGTVWFEGGR